MRIVHIAAEFAPLAKAGGLGEVITGLCRQLMLDHQEVDIILPKYNFISESSLPNIIQEMPPFPCEEFGEVHLNTMWLTEVENCRLHLLATDHPSGYFRRSHIYGYRDDIAKFIYFSKAALEYLRLQGKPIDILHLHDWHTALCAPLVKEPLLARELKINSVVFTIHNLEYQGKCSPEDLDAAGISGKAYLKPDLLQDESHPHNINLLKGAIVFSDVVTTVSPTYAKEIVTPSFSFHLHQTLIKYREKLFGIINGIDPTLWNPAKDPYIAAPFSMQNTLAQIMEAKTTNKQTLAKQFHLDASARPWVSVITRLVHQKGPELVEEALHYTLAQGGVFLLLGSSPIETIQHRFEQLKEHYKNHPRLLLELNYNEPLAHQIYAAADFILVPSHFEPCGLTQLIGMRYGTIPIVRSTGGLKDTVFDYENQNFPPSSRNGFAFEKPQELLPTLERAFSLQKQDPTSFQSLILQAIRSDHSWKKSAKKYLQLYKKSAFKQK